MSKVQGATPSGGPVVLVLTGPHGVGKSAHAGWLRTGLRKAGVRATLWAIAPPPAECVTPFDKALHYAMDRLRALHYARGIESEVLVVARWDESTCAAARAIAGEQGAMADAMVCLATCESDLRAVHVYRQLLDAPDAELDARLLRRDGRTQTPAERAEAAWMRHWMRPCAPILTDRPAEAVRADVLAWALGVLERHRNRAPGETIA